LINYNTFTKVIFIGKTNKLVNNNCYLAKREHNTFYSNNKYLYRIYDLNGNYIESLHKRNFQSMVDMRNRRINEILND